MVKGLLPPASCVKLVLALDFKLLQEIGIEDEEDINESLISHLTKNEDVFVAIDEMSLLRCCDRQCLAYPTFQNQDVFRDFVDAEDTDE